MSIKTYNFYLISKVKAVTTQAQSSTEDVSNGFSYKIMRYPLHYTTVILIMSHQSGLNVAVKLGGKVWRSPGEQSPLRTLLSVGRNAGS